MKLDLLLQPVDQPPLPIRQDNRDHERAGCIAIDRKNNLVLVRCADGRWIVLRNVAPPKKPAMSALEFANGYLHQLPIHSRRFGS